MIDNFVKEVTGEKLTFLNAADWIQAEPATPDQLIENIIDRGDKLAIIGLSKLWKSFLSMQLSICLAAGRPFLGWIIPQPRRVAHCQFEIREVHFHRRLRAMCRALDIRPENLGDRLQILNARGLGITGVNGIEKIKKNLDYEPEYIMIDPLYKIATGVENAAEDVKIILNAFDQLANDTGAAVAFVHHDPKGTPGDRDIRDRGAGSNVLGRDYDACLAMTGHAQVDHAVVVDVLLRNYPPQDPVVAEFANHDQGYCFHLCNDLSATKKTSMNKKQSPPLSSHVPIVETILDGKEMHVADFKELFKEKTGLSDNRIKEFLRWAQAGGKPFLLTREERGRGNHTKWVQINPNSK